jgi:hypothetical protein
VCYRLLALLSLASTSLLIALTVFIAALVLLGIALTPFIALAFIVGEAQCKKSPLGKGSKRAAVLVGSPFVPVAVDETFCHPPGLPVLYVFTS